MRRNNLRERFEAHEVALGAWLMIPNSIVSETVAPIGYDYVCVDMQHGLIGYSDALVMLQTLSLGDTTATVRVPWNEPGIIGKMLDAGAMAVIVPMVNNGAEAAAAISAGKYAPMGSRSSGPTRAQPLEGPEYADVANELTAIIPMIETVEAVDNIDDILATPGVEAIYVGPQDLSVSMGLGRDSKDPAFHDVLDHIAERCIEHGVVPGIHGSPALVDDRSARGYRMITAHSDLTAMRQSLVDALAGARGTEVHDVGSGGY